MTTPSTPTAQRRAPVKARRMWADYSKCDLAGRAVIVCRPKRPLITPYHPVAVLDLSDPEALVDQVAEVIEREIDRHGLPGRTARAALSSLGLVHPRKERKR